MNRHGYAVILMLLSFPLFFNGTCNPGSCPVNKVNLSSFYSDAGGQDIAIDPLGGYIFIYWIDQNGNVCHGEPGVSGQPGPVVISAFSQDAYDAAMSNSVITEEQMRQYQDFIYANANYHFPGNHFVQFDNVIWRSRSDGKVFMDRGSHFFSKPVIVNPENTVCLNPVYSVNDQACGRYSGIMVPHPVQNGGQHPTIGLSKSQPSAASMSDNDLMKYCLLKLPHGLEINE